MTSLFQQAFDTVRRSIDSTDELPDDFERWQVLDHLREPDRVIRFTVRWTDDDGHIVSTRAWRVQYCNAVGPYKGGLRFTPGVDEDTLLFLAFEQSLKNALTGLPLGGAKGGAQFSTADRSETEVLRFCQAFMDEYVRHGGKDVDVPAGDLGTSEREIGWLFGRFAKLTGRHVGMLTGKPEALGGIPGRVESTGYGVVHFTRLMLEHHGRDFEGARIAISGAGNVALHAAERAIERGARVVTLSNSSGTACFGEEGIDAERFAELKYAVGEDRIRLEDLAEELDWLEFRPDAKPWEVPCDVALPCATQNELDADDADALLRNGVQAVVEGANMPLTADAHELLGSSDALVAPGKAANAGGVVVSGFEMMQNAGREVWTCERVLTRLDETMNRIHARCVEWGEENGHVDYVRGANLAGFERIGRAIVAAGPN